MRERERERDILLSLALSGQGRQEGPVSPRPRLGHPGGQVRDRRDLGRLAVGVQAGQGLDESPR
eukprot:2439328-Heterocapsa_arctica.AAC.1